MDRIKLNINLSCGVRTSATVDELLYDYFAISIGQNPADSSCRRECEKWLEERLENLLPGSLSSSVRHLMVAEIAKPDLERKLQKLKMSVS